MFNADDEDLKLDYNYLESHRCFCGRGKDSGAYFCLGCLEYMPVHDMTELKRLKPGEGIAIAAQRIHAKLIRSQRKI
jgi:hypothetical protein